MAILRFLLPDQSIAGTLTATDRLSHSKRLPLLLCSLCSRNTTPPREPCTARVSRTQSLAPRVRPPAVTRADVVHQGWKAAASCSSSAGPPRHRPCAAVQSGTAVPRPAVAGLVQALLRVGCPWKQLQEANLFDDCALLEAAVVLLQAGPHLGGRFKLCCAPSLFCVCSLVCWFVGGSGTTGATESMHI